ILTNRHHTVLYTGVTGNLPRRLAEHRAKAFAGFTARYNLDRLAFHEAAPDICSVIASRQDKFALITHMNPTGGTSLPSSDEPIRVASDFCQSLCPYRHLTQVKAHLLSPQ
ncbi:MAG: GIY-YIG nuclease family protein, partial [Acetobacteraceae bacterium]